MGKFIVSEKRSRKKGLFQNNCFLKGEKKTGPDPPPCLFCPSPRCVCCRPKRQPKPSSDEGYWDCSVCTFRNSAEAFKCMMCDVRKGTSTR
uniref:YY1 associated factor 2 n=1 Tax=Chelonoidis abingdonii TaxID=106734 RepID=A0A8C0GE11_CHEAB